MDDNSQNRLTTGSVPRKMLLFALPIFLSNLFQQLYNAVDSLIVGQFIGQQALAAVSSSSSLILLLIGFINGVSLGAGVLIARFYGAEDEEHLERAVHTTLALGLAAGAVLTVLGVALSPLILHWMGTPADVIDNSILYFRVYFLGSIAVVLYNMGASILQSVGDSRSPMVYLILASLTNVVLDLLFVAVFRWGVSGAALATVLGQAVSCLTALVFCLCHRADLGLLPRWLRPEGSMVKRILKLGFPTALQWTIASISWLVVLALVNQHGVTISAANGVSNKIRDFCQLFISALPTGGGTMCAQCLGARLFDRAEQVMKTCLKLALALAAVIIVVAELFAPQFAMIFTPAPEVQRWAVINLRIEIICQLFYAAMFAYNTLATGSGHTMFVMLNSFLNCIVVRLILAVILNHFFGIYGVYVACGIAVSSSVPVCVWFYRSRRWITMKHIR